MNFNLSGILIWPEQEFQREYSMQSHVSHPFERCRRVDAIFAALFHRDEAFNHVQPNVNVHHFDDVVVMRFDELHYVLADIIFKYVWEKCQQWQHHPQHHDHCAGNERVHFSVVIRVQIELSFFGHFYFFLTLITLQGETVVNCMLRPGYFCTTGLRTNTGLPVAVQIFKLLSCGPMQGL